MRTIKMRSSIVIIIQVEHTFICSTKMDIIARTCPIEKHSTQISVNKRSIVDK